MVETTSLISSSEWENSSCCESDGCLDNVCYLNNASQVPLAPSVAKAGTVAVQHPPWDSHSDEDQAAVRRLFGEIIHAESKNIAIMPDTAFAMSLAAMNVQRLMNPQEEEGRILVLQDQMCSAVYPWQSICDTKEHVTLDIIPYPVEGGGWTEAVLERLGDNVLVACLPPVHWSDGSILDLTVISEKCRRHDVQLIVDATQAAGIMPLDVETIQPSLLAASVHKWLRGPIGASLVYVSPNVLDSWQPLNQHGRSRDYVIRHKSTWDASQNEMSPRGYPEKFINDARKFDGGGKPNPILLPMIREGLELVTKLNLARVQSELKELTQPILEWADGNGFSVSPGQHAHHIIGIRPRNEKMTPQDMVDVSEKLKEEGIFIAVRCGAFRISPYIDTKKSDIDVLLEGLHRHCRT